MPRIRKNVKNANYKKAKSELNEARRLMEHKEDPLHDKINRFNAAKKSRNFFEEKWKRMNTILQKSKKLKNTKRTKELEEELAYLEKNMEALDERLELLTIEIREEHQNP